MNLSITPLPPQDLHVWWRVLLPGIETIVRKVGRENVDFEPEDLYVAIRTGAATAYAVMRGQRLVGWFLLQVQTRPFSCRKELLLWQAYSIPLRERQDGDNIPEALRETMEYIRNQAKTAGCDSILFLSTRRGWERYGFKMGPTAWRQWI